MARNLEKDAGSEARLIRIAESACQKETCAIQYCLQGILIYLAVSYNCEINIIVYFSKLSAPIIGLQVLPNVICLSVCLANKYQQKRCGATIKALERCCERLSPQVLRFSDKCQTILRSKDEQ